MQAIKMGQSKAQKLNTAAFLAQYPICCFCGGNTPATTVGHVPNRAFFERKMWPDGYIFPACDVCQGDARTTDLVTAAVARISPGMSSTALREVRALYAGFRNNDREAFLELYRRA
jgi:hypothetical protein